MTQSVRRPTLDLASGCDLSIMRRSSGSGSALSVEPAWDSLPLPPPALALTLNKDLSLKKEKALEMDVAIIA